MDPTKQSRVEAWLQYADDLNLGPFFRNRGMSADGEALSSQLAPIATVTEPPQSRQSMPPPTAVTPVPVKPTAAPPSYGPPVAVKTPTAPILAAKVPEISLFEEKIENDSLEKIRADIGPNCTRCKLHKARTNIVFGVGNPKAELMFVGEGPGADEDAKGEPFVGRAGKLLTQMIEQGMGLKRADVYIANVVKCRPPENRLPEKDEIATCSPYLMRQIDVIKPKVVVCLGSCSAQTLLQTTQGISKFRGEWFDFRGSKLMATYHPAYLLRNPPAKADVWKDLQKVMAFLGLEVKKRN
jgi:uracil-DNA glycosylase family 4